MALTNNICTLSEPKCVTMEVVNVSHKLPLPRFPDPFKTLHTFSLSQPLIEISEKRVLRGWRIPGTVLKVFPGDLRHWGN